MHEAADEVKLAAPDAQRHALSSRSAVLAYAALGFVLGTRVDNRPALRLGA